MKALTERLRASPTSQIMLEAADYIDALEAHNEMQAAQLRKQAEQMEAIGAGGVSGQRITGGGNE